MNRTLPASLESVDELRAARWVRESTEGPYDNDERIRGHSYPQDWYEDAVQMVLERIGRFDDASISEVVRLHQALMPYADELALALIARAREEASRQLTQTRDLAKWQATMSRLDEEERIAQEPAGSSQLSAAEIVEYAH